eukprot:3588881-Rhodomonas_salina.1
MPASSTLLNTVEMYNVHTHDEIIACNSGGGGVHDGKLVIAWERGVDRVDARIWQLCQPRNGPPVAVVRSQLGDHYNAP